MALAKLSACAAGCALIGGGAVHVAETPAKEGHYRSVKGDKRVAVVRTVKPVRHLAKRTYRVKTVRRLRKV